MCVCVCVYVGVGGGGHFIVIFTSRLAAWTPAEPEKRNKRGPGGSRHTWEQHRGCSGISRGKLITVTSRGQQRLWLNIGSRARRGQVEKGREQGS